MIQRYIITKESDDGTFKVGDHVIFYGDGSIGCVEAKGWILPHEAALALVGAKYQKDHEYYKNQIKKFKKEMGL